MEKSQSVKFNNVVPKCIQEFRKNYMLTYTNYAICENDPDSKSGFVYLNFEKADLKTTLKEAILKYSFISFDDDNKTFDRIAEDAKKVAPDVERF